MSTPITRYIVTGWEFDVEPTETGDWVKFDDHEKALAEVDSGKWYRDGLSVACDLACAGVKSAGIVEGVREIIAERDAALKQLALIERAGRV